MAMNLKNIPADQLQAAIWDQQAIQKHNPPSSLTWQVASKALQPLFAEMARRYPKGTVGPSV